MVRFVTVLALALVSSLVWGALVFVGTSYWFEHLVAEAVITTVVVVSVCAWIVCSLVIYAAD